jgi:RHH-type transcriptional regulator, rel operon repressor / antitoxin RelB
MFFNDAAGRLIMLTIRLDKEIEHELDVLTRMRGSNRSEVVREAIIRYLEDHEDLRLAREALSLTESTKSIKQLRKALEVDC